MGVPLCSAGHTQGLSSQETPEEWQKCCSQPSCRLRGGTKGLSHGDLPLWASREEQGRKGSWSCHISAWHRHEPQSGPWSWSSSHSTQHCGQHCGHAAGGILGLWEAEKQERIAGSKEVFPKAAGSGSRLQDAQEFDCCPRCSQDSLTESSPKPLSLEIALVKYLLG